MIIFLNGSINAGKSTIAKILIKKVPNSALLEIDVLREMIEWMPIEQAVPINIINSIALIKNFVKNDLNVVVPYPLSQINYDLILNEMKDIKTKIYFFTLSPKLEKILTNRGDRELSDWEKERIKYHYKVKIQKPTFGEIIDNSEQTPEETANYILNKIN